MFATSIRGCLCLSVCLTLVPCLHQCSSLKTPQQRLQRQLQMGHTIQHKKKKWLELCSLSVCAHKPLQSVALVNYLTDASQHFHMLTVKLTHIPLCLENTHTHTPLLSNEYFLFFETSVYDKWIISGLNYTFFPCGPQPKLYRVPAIFSPFELCPAFLCPRGVFKIPTKDHGLSLISLAP